MASLVQRKPKLSVKGSGLITPTSSRNNSPSRKANNNNHKKIKPSTVDGNNNHKKIKPSTVDGNNKPISRMRMRKKKKKKDALVIEGSTSSKTLANKPSTTRNLRRKKVNKKKQIKQLKSSIDNTQDDIRALIEKVAVEFDKNNPALGPWNDSDDIPVKSARKKNQNAKTKIKGNSKQKNNRKKLSSSMEEYDDIFEARRIVNGIKLDLMIDEDDNSNIVINSIQEHQEKNDNGQKPQPVIENEELKREEDDINRRTRLLQYEMNELKIRKIHLLINKNRNDLENQAVQTYKKIDFGSKEKINKKITLLREDYTDRCEQLKLLENELSNKIQLLTNMKRAVEKQRIYFLDSCKKEEASIEVQRLEYLEKFKKNLLIEMNKKLQIIIDTNKWNDLVIVGSESDKPEESSKDGDEKSSHGSRTKITVSKIMF